MLFGVEKISKPLMNLKIHFLPQKPSAYLNHVPSSFISPECAFTDFHKTQILWLCFALAWGTIHLFTARGRLPEGTVVDSAENVWSFGQFLPVVLLMLPILSIAEDCYGKTRLLESCMLSRAIYVVSFRSLMGGSNSSHLV